MGSSDFMTFLYCFKTILISIYRSHTLKSRGFYGNSTLFFKRSQYISLDFDILRKSQKPKCSIEFRILKEAKGMLYLVLLYNDFAYFAEQSLVSPKR